jgi:hypothetical protein
MPLYSTNQALRVTVLGLMCGAFWHAIVVTTDVLWCEPDGKGIIRRIRPILSTMSSTQAALHPLLALHLDVCCVLPSLRSLVAFIAFPCLEYILFDELDVPCLPRLLLRLAV